MGITERLKGLLTPLRDQRNRYAQQRARDNAAVQAGSRRHWCIAHVWGSEEEPGAQMVLYSVGDAPAERSQTRVTVEFLQQLPPGTPIATQRAGLKQTIVRLASAEPSSALHYVSYYAGFGRPGYDDLARNGELRGLMAAQVALTNNGPRSDDELLWRRAKQDAVYQCALALPYLTLPVAPEFNLLPDQLKKYRFTRTERLPDGSLSVSDSDRDNLVLALSLGVLKLQRERWRKKCYLPPSFDPQDNDNDGLRPLMQPVRLM